MSPEHKGHPAPHRHEWEGKVQYKHYNHATEHPFHTTHVFNIGHDGLVFLTEEPIAAGTLLILKLTRYQDYAPVKVLAQVRHSVKYDGDNHFQVDCLYHDLTRAEQAAVAEIVEEVGFIHRIHKKVLETLRDHGIDAEPQPHFAKPIKKHGPSRA